MFRLIERLLSVFIKPKQISTSEWRQGMRELGLGVKLPNKQNKRKIA